ncbi:hypothetical protein [Nonomuraea sp. NPDC050310]|uniref:hypothetical protein n=1 Tax=Nonomuraea sp. NPDC050310 TaxID=3154935 RepID=UPI0033C4AB63
MIGEHAAAEAEALRRSADLLAGLAEGAPAETDLRRHADHLIAELARIAATTQSPTAGPADPTAWERLAGLRQEAARLRAQALSYAQALLLRRAGLDGGAGEAAEALVAFLCRAAGLDNRIVLGVDAGPESFTRDLDLVLLPPHPDVWHLPVVAHESGHYAVREVRHAADKDRRPLRELIELIEGGEAAPAHAEELVADAFATYALGPAYPLSCVALRIDPTTAHLSGPTHPSWDRRVHVLLHLLAAMDARYGTGQYGAGADRVKTLWARLTGRPEPDRDGGPSPAASILAQLDRHLPAARYEAGSLLVRAREALRTRAVPPPGVTPAHLLNAAWSLRLRGERVAGLDARVLTLLARKD